MVRIIKLNFKNVLNSLDLHQYKSRTFYESLSIVNNNKKGGFKLGFYVPSILQSLSHHKTVFGSEFL